MAWQVLQAAAAAAAAETAAAVETAAAHAWGDRAADTAALAAALPVLGRLSAQRQMSDLRLAAAACCAAAAHFRLPTAAAAGPIAAAAGRPTAAAGPTAAAAAADMVPCLLALERACQRFLQLLGFAAACRGLYPPGGCCAAQQAACGDSFCPS